jgi:predicted dinucleotide-binding enzyme
MCSFEVPDAATMTVSRRQVNEIKEIGRYDQAVRHAAELITSQISPLTESSAKRDVILLALPVPFIEKLVNAKSEEQFEGAEEEDVRPRFGPAPRPQ